MKDYVNSAEVETKACRETIMRLVAEAEKEQKASTRYGVELDNLRVVSGILLMVNISPPSLLQS